MSQDESSWAEVREAESWYLRSIEGETETSFELFRIDILGLQGHFHPIIAPPEKGVTDEGTDENITYRDLRALAQVIFFTISASK